MNNKINWNNSGIWSGMPPELKVVLRGAIQGINNKSEKKQEKKKYNRIEEQDANERELEQQFIEQCSEEKRQRVGMKKIPIKSPNKKDVIDVHLSLDRMKEAIVLQTILGEPLCKTRKRRHKNQEGEERGGSECR